MDPTTATSPNELITRARDTRREARRVAGEARRVRRTAERLRKQMNDVRHRSPEALAPR